LEMAVQGWEWPAISDELGYADRSGAWKAAQRALKRRAATAVDSYRRMMLAELDMVQDSAWGAAMRGNMRASEVVVRAIDQRVRLLGLDRSSVEAAKGVSQASEVSEECGAQQSSFFQQLE